MSRVVVLGAGISGHTAAAFLRKWLGRDDEVIVVSPKPTYNWIPSNIWVGVGVMSPADVVFPLGPVYERHGIRADIQWISNEYELGDFGMGGMHLKRGGYVTPSKIFMESLFVERDIHWITRAHVRQLDPGLAHYETIEGPEREIAFDFAMLLPPFTGVGLKAFDRLGEDITARLFRPNGFMTVDAEYSPRPFEEWRAADWPRTYQSPAYRNLFAAGIAFAPPHAISRPYQTPSGAPVAPAPPRTGMPSAMIGKAVARSVVDMLGGSAEPTHTSSMATMGAACVASAGANPFRGTAASLTVYPIVPDFERYPGYGRDVDQTSGEIGLAGHWIKILLHHAFLYKAQLKPGWSLIPE